MSYVFALLHRRPVPGGVSAASRSGASCSLSSTSAVRLRRGLLAVMGEGEVTCTLLTRFLVATVTAGQGGMGMGPLPEEEEEDWE